MQTCDASDVSDVKVCEKKRRGRPKKSETGVASDMKAYMKEYNKKVVEEKGEVYKKKLAWKYQREMDQRKAYKILREIHQSQWNPSSELKEQVAQLFNNTPDVQP